MRRPTRVSSKREPGRKWAFPVSARERLASLLALVTIGCLALTFFMSNSTQFLMPGPLTSAHGVIENCGACHTKSGTGKVAWLHGLVAGDPAADSKACLACHKMPNTAFNAHGASPEALKISTKRLTKIAATTSAPVSVRAQNIAFPTQDVMQGGLYCATCHQEHQGGSFALSKVTNAQCQSCHVVKFDSFDGNHPKFDNYPFGRRTRITYDHAGHFGKHFPEMAKKDPPGAIPATCSTCHNSRGDKRIMAVAPFTETCTSCHLDQITGKERATGPKGIAFLTVPGLDLQTLKEKNASIGEWPEASEAPLTPFMKVMISRNQRGRALIKTVNGLNLQDLSGANDDQIKAVTNLVWEIKGLFYALISGKASDVLADLNMGSGAKLSASLVADLTASIPRDVVISAHQQWLPDLATEMANRPVTTSDQDQSGWGAAITETKLSASVSPEELSGSGARLPGPRLSPEAAGSEAASVARPIRLAQSNQQVQTKNAPGIVAEKSWQVDPYGRVDKGPADEAEAARAKSAQPAAAAVKADAVNARPDAVKEAPSADVQPRARAADQTDDLLSPDGGAAEARTRAPEAEPRAAQPAAAAAKTDTATAKPDAARKETPSAEARPQTRATGQNDDLLFPDGGAPEAASGRASSSDSGAGSAAPDANAPSDAASAPSGWAPDGTSPGGAETEGAEPQRRAAPVISIKSDVDPESWAEYGGWYEQDHAIFYRPTGHKDKFIYSWLFLTGPQAPKGNASPAASVFDYLIAKDAQGSCTKCHSVDDIKGKGRLVNFSPPKIETKQGRFTNFIHEPHFGILENRGCLTCHNLEKGRPYLKSYEQSDPQKFVSNFGAVKKELCQTCHTSSMASQDCLLCHKYHVNGVITPIMNTRIPVQ